MWFPLIERHSLGSACSSVDQRKPPKHVYVCIYGVCVFIIRVHACLWNASPRLHFIHTHNVFLFFCFLVFAFFVKLKKMNAWAFIHLNCYLAVRSVPASREGCIPANRTTFMMMWANEWQRVRETNEWLRENMQINCVSFRFDLSLVCFLLNKDFFYHHLFSALKRNIFFYGYFVFHFGDFSSVFDKKLNEKNMKLNKKTTTKIFIEHKKKMIK